MEFLKKINAALEPYYSNVYLRWSLFALLFLLVLYNVTMYNRVSSKYSDNPENIYSEEESTQEAIEGEVFQENLEEYAQEQKFAEEELKQNFFYDEVFIFRDVINSFAIPYDESTQASTFDNIKQVDNTLLQVLNRLTISLENLKIDSSYIKLKKNNYYLFQKFSLFLPSETSPKEFTETLKEHIALWPYDNSKRVSVKFSSKNNTISIYIDSEFTHEIIINKSQEIAKMSIVIDDLGVGTDALYGLLSLDFPVSFSILPKNPQAKLYAELGHFTKREIFLHQPMEAENKIFSVPEGLSVNNSIEEIKKKLEANFERVPYAVALNNHTGSAFTADRQAVINFLIALKEVRPKMKILDSYTIGNSKLHSLAQNYFEKTAKRDVFIDNIIIEDEIIKQLDFAMNKALNNPKNHIIAIGHPHKATIKALQNWNSYKDKNIEIIPVF